MATWGLFFLLFAFIWVLQFYMAHFQMKNYRKTIREMSQKDSGYLGVGVEKKKFGKGVVTVVVCNEEGIIIDAKKMSGVTVFSRFEEFSEVLGRNIHETADLIKDKQVVESLQSAIAKIEEQKPASSIS